MLSPSEASVSPRLYLLLENPRKSNNLGPILRCAAAFGITQVVAVGFDKCSTEGSHGAAKHVAIVAFPTVEQAVSYLRSQGCSSLIGLLGGVADAYDSDGYSVHKEEERIQVAVQPPEALSAKKRSFPIHVHPFVEGNCCFVISKNWNGLPISLANQCDFYAHIPHVEIAVEGTLGSRLLDTASCLSIALHHFAAWAKYDERDFQGHKFEVGGRERSNHEKEATRSARAEARRQMESADAIGDDVLGGMFSAEPSGDY